MPNIQLTIEAQDGRVAQKLAEAETGVRKLEAAVKIGDKTMRGNITTEEQAIKTLDKFAAAEKRLAEATASRHKNMGASFAQAQARALNDAEEANFKRAQKRMAEMAQAHEKQSNAWRRGVSEAGAFAGGIVGIGSAAAVAGVAIAKLGEEQQRLLDKAKQSDRQATGMKDLVSALPGGAAGEEALRKISLIGAQNGMAPDATAAIAGPLYATADKNSDGKLDDKEQAAFDKNLGAGAMLGSAGVKAEDATNVILAGDNKGVAGEDTAAKLLKAAAISKRGPAEFSRSASAISQFGDLNTGMAVTTALSAAELNPERLAERTKDAQLSLSSAADSSTFSKKHKLAGLSETEKIAKLRGEALASGDVKKFTDQFKNEGLDEGKAISMGMLIQQGELYGNAEKQIKETSAKDLAPAIQKLKDNPITGSQMRSDEAKALAQNNAVFGVESQKARDKQAEAIGLGARLTRDGGDQAVDPETGQAKPWYTWDGYVGRQEAQRKRIVRGEKADVGTWFNGSSAPSGGDAGSNANASLDALTKALQENTTVTRENSQSTKKSTPTGGNPANAEEKF